MKILYILIGSFISLVNISSTQNESSVGCPLLQRQVNSTTIFQNSDSSKWTDNFLELQKAISTGDRNAVKSFIDFPIKNKGNEIWYLADSKLVMKISPKEIKPFTEADFDKYFNSIFALDLRKTFEQLNVEELFKTNKSTSPEIEVIKDSKNKLEVKNDNTKHKITLALVTIFNNRKNFKYTIYYQFDVLKNQQIKFRQVHVE